MKEKDNTSLDVERGEKSREELEQHLRARAWKDDAFRQEFQADPKGVLQRDYAQWFPKGNIPSELSIKVIEEEEQSLYFVLPPKSPDNLSEIDKVDEEELLGLSEVVGAGPHGSWTCGYSTMDICCLREIRMK